MIRTAAHTMATPDLSLSDAVALIADLGFDGVEIVRADDYICAIPTRPTPAALAHVRRVIDDLGLVVANIVPYVRATNAVNEAARKVAIDELHRTVDVAVALGSASVRVLAGAEPDPDRVAEQRALLVDSLRQLAPHAEQAGVVLSVENHMSSHAVSGAITAAIVREVNSPHVRVLYDPANLLILGDADYRAAFEVQAPLISHVHFKDVEIFGNGQYMPRVNGSGEVPWEWIMPALVDSGYSGYVSTEFEKRWHSDDLPSSRDGLTHELAALRQLLAAEPSNI